jgi:DNA-binding LytR/AlgR family response regulator
MTRALIVEDEAPQRAELLNMLRKLWPELTIAHLCEDGLAAMDALAESPPNVAFVDIRIPGVTGLEVARAASAAGVHVVFTTAYDHYAAVAFDQRAVDYLLKPVSEARLADCIARLKERLAAGAAPNPATATLAEPEANAAPLKWITASAGDTIRMVPIEEVLFFQSQDKYTRVVTADLDTHIRTPLKDLVAGLDGDRFWVIHRSAIVRVDAIETVRRDDTGKLLLSVKGKHGVLAVSAAYQWRFRAM